MLDHRYETFALLTKNKSYTQTAKELYISQPAVSQQIKSLETELQLKLVEYHHPRLRITPAGEHLAHFVETTQHQEAKLIQQLQNPVSSTNLKFGVTHSVSIFMAPDLIRRWQKQYNQIQCVVSNTQQILQKIDNGELDFAILEGNFDKAAYGNQVISQESFVAVTRTSCPLVHRLTLTLEDLLDEPLLLRERGSGTRSIFTDWASSFNIHQEDFAQVLEIGSSIGIINLLKTTGVSFMYRSLIEEPLQQQELAILKVKGLDITRPISLVYAKNSFFEQHYQQLFR
jgi:DNA-binding transcriptional LysR family regulator